MIPLSHRSYSRSRGATVLMELMIAIILALAAMAGVARLAAIAAGQYRLLDEQSIASREVAAAMEDLMSRPWNEIASSNSIALPVSSVARAALSNVKLRVTVGPRKIDPKPEVRRVEVAIHWTTAVGQPAAPVRLVAWRYRTKEARQ